LKLGSGYENIYKNYDPYIRQRLSRLNKFLLRYSHSQNYSEAINIYKELYHNRLASFSTDDFLHFETLCKYYAEKGRIVIRHVKKEGDDKLLALILLLKDDKRIYNIISCILPEGKKLLANYFLYNEIIKEFANENIILDFEGSDVPGIAYFYEKFSGENQPYAFARFNRLPALVKLIKP
jgi:lipid II:glycine glycyltransferase (peptidoglycan interpeptide bridge formation enzyme)